MPKVKTKPAQDTVADVACGVVMSGMVGRSGGGEQTEVTGSENDGNKVPPFAGDPFNRFYVGAQ